MYVVAGITGNTGAAVARTLLERGASVRAVVRDPERARGWASRGVELVAGDFTDAASLARAFAGAEGAYVLNPPAYTLPDLFGHAEQIAEAIREAVERSGLSRLVVLSSFGAHLPSGTGIIQTNRIFERRLGPVHASATFVRPTYFMQNWAAVASAAANDGALPSFLAPLDRAIPMTSTGDIGRVAAEAMLTSEEAPPVIEITGPGSYAPQDAASAFASALGRPVQAVPLPEDQWPAVLGGMGFADRTIEAWVEMFRGFNAGTIALEGVGEPVLGRITLDEAVSAFPAAAA